MLELELVLRFLTGEGWREEDAGDGCLAGEGLRLRGDGLRLRGEGLRRLPAGATGGEGAVMALLYLDVISIVRVLRTTLTFSAGGRPP